MAGLSVNEVTTYRWSFEEDVAQYRACGIDAIGIWRQKLDDCGAEKAVAVIATSGLAVSNLLWAGGFTGSNGHSYSETVADTCEALRLAAALGTRHLVVYSGSRNGHTQNHARRILTSALDEVLPRAADLDVTIAVEPMHVGCADEWTFLNDLDEAVGLVKSIDNPYLKLAFDTYHWGHEPDIAARIGSMAQYIGIVHLSDGKCPPACEQNRYGLGEGTLPLAGIVRALRQAGYDGYYDVELFGEEIENSDYRQLLADSKRAYERLLEA